MTKIAISTFAAVRTLLNEGYEIDFAVEVIKNPNLYSPTEGYFYPSDVTSLAKNMMEESL